MEPQSRTGPNQSGLDRNEIKDEEGNRYHDGYSVIISKRGLYFILIIIPGFVEIGTVIESETKSRIGNGARIRNRSETGTKIERDQDKRLVLQTAKYLQEAKHKFQDIIQFDARDKRSVSRRRFPFGRDKENTLPTQMKTDRQADGTPRAGYLQNNSS
ncbi:hypothetical protein EVAR_95623_1 [Eumeta japonica]|uniref:Uncharacterized protein n=1 Tax=Eumeta variegata TaxID=151549 RepID=A0A4C1VK79_EUMVA|nr:hypothetical protein EVAR_95623_1 [Eumeta japonica]